MIAEAAEAVVGDRGDRSSAPTRRRFRRPGAAGALEAKGASRFGEIARVLLRQHRRRTVLGLSLMIAQAFAYNGVFFTYALVLGASTASRASDVGLYLLPFALGQPPRADRARPPLRYRRPPLMIALTYAASGVLLAVTGYGVAHGGLTAVTQTVLWCAVFFVASAAASSAYLTVSELFPVELRGHGDRALLRRGHRLSGASSRRRSSARSSRPGSRARVFIAYLVGAALMVLAAAVAAAFGVPAERKSLEAINEL